MSSAPSPTIPSIDISLFAAGDPSEKAEVAVAIDEACRKLGFLIVTGHGVPPELVAEMRAVTMDFFDLTNARKRAYAMRGSDGYRGYTVPGSESLAASYGVESRPDVKESFSIGPVEVPADDYHAAGGTFFAPNRWPNELPAFRDVWSRYYAAMEDLAGILMRAFALTLGLPEEFFDRKVDRHITNFSAIHYPPPEQDALPGELRGGAHTDFGSLTILQRDDAPGGLEVMVGGEWITAPHVPDSFTINIGDLMAEWTNDRWVSTIHRVALPKELGSAESERLSLVFFHQPNYDAIIEVLPTCRAADDPPKYDAITSGGHIAKKLAAMQLTASVR